MLRKVVRAGERRSEERLVSHKGAVAPNALRREETGLGQTAAPPLLALAEAPDGISINATLSQF